MAKTNTDDWLSRLDQRILGWVWRPGRARQGPAKWGNSVLQVAYLSLRSSYKDRLPFQANALTFITLLGLVPALAISFSLAKGLGFSNALKRVVINNEFTASQTEIFQYIIRYVDNTQVGTLGVVGFVLLIATLILALSNMEQVFNRIWEVSSERSWLRKVTDYLSVLVICPLFMVAATGAWAGFLSHEMVRWLLDVAVVGKLAQWGLSMGPFVLLAAAFVFFYLFLPNTSVPLGSAVVAGVIASGLWWGVQSLYIAFQVGVARYNAIYGGFASLPLFMIWMHVSWTVMLYGAELARAHHICRHGPLPSFLSCPLRPIQQEALALHLMYLAGLRFHRGLPPRSLDGLAHDLQVPRVQVQSAVSALETVGLVAEVGEHGLVQPGRSLGTIAVADIFEAVHGIHQPAVTGYVSAGNQILDDLLAKAASAGREALGQTNLLQLVEKADPKEPLSRPSLAEQPVCVMDFSQKT